MKHLVCSLSIVLAMLSLVGCCGNKEKVKETVFERQVTIGSHSAVSPVPIDPNSPIVKQYKMNLWWLPRHNALVEKAKQGNVELIMIGDSITQGWDKQGKAAWDQYYSGRKALNMGFAGDRTQNILWRLDNGEIAGISPRLAILLIGTNNAHDNSPEQIADGIAAILQKLRTDLPQTKILLLAIFPNGRVAGAQPVIDQTNAIIRKFADNRHIFFLDINKIWLNPDGSINTKLMPELLHPNTQGYEVWAKAMEPTIEKLLKK